MLLDVKLLAATNGDKRLDDVLKAAYERFYAKEKRGFKEAELQALIEKETGVSVDDIFAAAHAVGSPDYNPYLNAAGYEEVESNARRDLPDLGITTTQTAGRATVTGNGR